MADRDKLLWGRSGQSSTRSVKGRGLPPAPRARRDVPLAETPTGVAAFFDSPVGQTPAELQFEEDQRVFAACRTTGPTPMTDEMFAEHATRVARAYVSVGFPFNDRLRGSFRWIVGAWQLAGTPLDGWKLVFSNWVNGIGPPPDKSLAPPPTQPATPAALQPMPRAVDYQTQMDRLTAAAQNMSLSQASATARFSGHEHRTAMPQGPPPGLRRDAPGRAPAPTGGGAVYYTKEAVAQAKRLREFAAGLPPPNSQ